MTTTYCPEHGIETTIYARHEETEFIDNNANTNAIFTSLDSPKRISKECRECAWLLQLALDSYED